MEKSGGTDRFMVDCDRLLSLCVKHTAEGNHAEAAAAFELIFAVFKHIDECLDDVDCYTHYSFQDAMTTYFNMDIREWGWVDDWDNSTYDWLEVSVDADILWTGPAEQAEMFSSQFALIPEPTTLALLTIGTTAFIVRRRNNNRPQRQLVRL